VAAWLSGASSPLLGQTAKAAVHRADDPLRDRMLPRLFTSEMIPSGPGLHWA